MRWDLYFNFISKYAGFHTPVSPHSITDSRSTILSSPTRLLYDIVPPTLTSSPAAVNRLPSMNSSATGDENDVYEDAQSKTSQQSTGMSMLRVIILQT